MTFRELLSVINKMSDKQLDSDIIVADNQGNFREVDDIRKASESHCTLDEDSNFFTLSEDIIEDKE